MNTDNTTQLFTPTADGQAHDMQPAGVFLILADMVYRPQDDPEWIGGPKPEAMIQAMLAVKGHESGILSRH